MKVQDSNSMNLHGLHRTESIASLGNARSSSVSKGRGDHVQISTLSSLLSALSVHSEERATKIVQLADAVASGRYKVDAHAVSGKLIQEHLLAAA